jgi:hypothetical protein
MRTIIAAFVVGVGFGAVAVQAIYAQVKPPGYLIAEVQVTHPATYKHMPTPPTRSRQNMGENS